MTGRYVYCPMTSRKLCRRITLAERIRRHFRRRETPDLYETIGYCSPVFPGK